jgi:internalin A
LCASKRQRKQDSAPSSLLTLPKELLIVIASFLEVEDFISLTLTCKDLQEEKVSFMVFEVNPSLLTNLIFFNKALVNPYFLKPLKNRDNRINKLIEKQGKLITELDLSGNANVLTSKHLESLTNITTLNLASNKMITGTSLKLLTNIAALNLASNKMITDTSLKLLTNITELSLASNKVITDEALSLLPNITGLNLGCNEVITDDALSLLTNITGLNLACNEVITGTSLKLLTNITGLSLYCNKLITDGALSLLTNINSLNLWNNTTITINGLTDLHNLTYLDVEGSNITLDKLTQLTGDSYAGELNLIGEW